MEWLAVCSDEDVSRFDDPAMKTVDLGIDVSTNPEAIASFLSKSSHAVKVVMTTYQSGRVVSEGAGMAKVSFDLGIFDEAHKTVGSEGGAFAHLLSDKNIPISRRVFMTATERQYRGASDDILSMDDAFVYGETFDQLSFKAALELNPPILSDYRIISIIVTKSEIERLIREQAFVRSDGKEWNLEADAPDLRRFGGSSEVHSEAWYSSCGLLPPEHRASRGVCQAERGSKQGARSTRLSSSFPRVR